jgi:hypothetical protein
MKSTLARAISTTTALDIAIRRVDEHRSFATIVLAGKLEISNIRIKTKRGSTRVFWPMSGPAGAPVFPIVRILDDQLRKWIESEIVQASEEAQLRKAQAQSA